MTTSPTLPLPALLLQSRFHKGMKALLMFILFLLLQLDRVCCAADRRIHHHETSTTTTTLHQRERVVGGRVRAWDALNRLDYDIAFAIVLILVVVLAWGRAAYLHWTVQSLPDKYKPKYH